MKTREELVNGALEVLGVWAAGQKPAAEDYRLIDERVVPVLSGLSERNIYPFGDPDKIDDQAFISLTVILAGYAPTGFGTLPTRDDRLLAENALREIYAETLSGQPLQVDYF